MKAIRNTLAGMMMFAILAVGFSLFAGIFHAIFIFFSITFSPVLAAFFFLGFVFFSYILGTVLK